MMKKNNDILKIISNETLDATHSIPVVTPSIYATLFEEKAKSHSIHMDEEKEFNISREILIKECENLVDMREKNDKNAIRLSSSTSKAIDAIKKKDEKLLNDVLKETEELRREIESLRKTIYKDDLTSAYNRKYLKDNYLEEGSENFSKNGILAIIDMNDFKDINDTYGHAIGDKVLIFIANNLKKTKADVIRFGGDEFIIMFDDTFSIEEAISKVDMVHEIITHKKLKAKKGEFRVGFSIGIASFKKSEDFNDIFEIADKKMYENKEQMKSISEA